MYGKRNYEKVSQFVEEANLDQEYDDYHNKRGGSYDYDNQPKYMNRYSYSDSAGYNTKTNVSAYIPKPQSINYVTDYSQVKNNIDISKYKEGQIVGHPKFGVGTIISITEDNKMADINFGALGKKTLMLNIAPLTIIKQ